MATGDVTAKVTIGADLGNEQVLAQRSFVHALAAQAKYDVQQTIPFDASPSPVTLWSASANGPATASLIAVFVDPDGVFQNALKELALEVTVAAAVGVYAINQRAPFLLPSTRGGSAIGTVNDDQLTLLRVQNNSDVETDNVPVRVLVLG